MPCLPVLPLPRQRPASPGEPWLLLLPALPAAAAAATNRRRRPALSNLHSPPQIAAADIIGATASGSELTIWSAPMATRPGADKPSRQLARTPPLTLESPALAQQAMAHLRAACCWPGGRQAPRLLVVVNPASGPGRRVAGNAAGAERARQQAGRQAAVHTPLHRSARCPPPACAAGHPPSTSLRSGRRSRPPASSCRCT